MESAQEFVSFQDLEQEIGMSRPTLLRKLAKANIKVYQSSRQGRRRFVKRADLTALLEEHFVEIENPRRVL